MSNQQLDREAWLDDIFYYVQTVTDTTASTLYERVEDAMTEYPPPANLDPQPTVDEVACRIEIKLLLDTDSDDGGWSTAGDV